MPTVPHATVPDPPVGLLDLLLPRPCAGCGALHGPWCQACRHALPVGLLVRDVATTAGLGLPVTAATRYGDRARRLLLAYKEEGRHELVAVLAPLLARAVLGTLLGAGGGGAGATGRFWLVPVPSRPRSRRRRGADVGLLLAYKEEGRHELVAVLAPLLARAVLGTLLGAGGGGAGATGRFWLVPVPSRPRSRRRRGADVGLLLARRTACELRASGWPAAVAPVLRHQARSVDQAELGRDDRARNVAGTLAGRRRPVAGEAWPAIVTDDIVTTGSTVREALRALERAGWPMLGGAVVAATPGASDPSGGGGRRGLA